MVAHPRRCARTYDACGMGSGDDAPARDLIGYRASFTSADPMLAALLDRAYGAFPIATRAEHRVVVEPAPDDGSGLSWRLVVDDVPSTHAATAGALLGALVGTVNRATAEASPHVLVHAGAVERRGVGIVLPAPMESGKSTLTTALVRAGFGYLTDEAAAFDRTTRMLVPYPKPITLDEGSWALFPELEPHEPFTDNAYKARQWQVLATDLGPGAVGRSCPARFVVFPAYAPDATTRLVPLGRAEALVELARNTFGFDREGKPTFALLAEVLRGAEAFRLPLRDLDTAVGLVSGLVD
jgi:hypothetical protein